MRCPHCNGNLIYSREVYPSLERLYCLQCGREPRKVLDGIKLMRKRMGEEIIEAVKKIMDGYV